MAYTDYYLCNVCGKKAFYDSNLNYAFDSVTGGMTLDYVGQMAALCDVCAQTHHIEVRQNDGTLLSKWDGTIVDDATPRTPEPTP